MEKRAIFVTDFDGTLARNDRTFSGEDISALKELSESGCSIVLASGRSPFSLWRCLGERTLPVDWYVLSSGAGILSSEGAVEVSHVLTEEETYCIHDAFTELGIGDVSIQGPFPDAHLLHWIPGDHGTDFRRRLEFYRGFSCRIDSPNISASEVIGFVEPERAEAVLDRLNMKLGERFSIIRATSPLDGYTVWVEIFRRGVNKGSGCEFIRRELNVPPEMTAAVGNDWNDVHMLEWAESPFVTSNAPEPLLKTYPAVPSNQESGVAQAARIWLERIS